MAVNNDSERKARFGGCVGSWWTRVLRQELWGFTPHFSEAYVIFTYFIFGLVLIAFGIVLLFESLQVKEARIRYDNTTKPLGSNISYIYNVTEDWNEKVYLYYEITNFYQNHKRYVRSVDWNQVNKDKPQKGSSVCQPLLYKNGPVSTTAENKDEDFVVPCGLLPWSYFSDQFYLEKKSDDKFQRVELNETGIAWKVDRDNLYGSTISRHFQPAIKGGANIGYEDKTADVVEGTVPLNQDEHFMVWMRVDARPNIRKLYASFEKPLKKGDQLQIYIHNNYDTSSFKGEKYVVLSTLNFLGGRNHVLGITYIVVGVLGLLAALLILGLKYRLKQPADPALLNILKASQVNSLDATSDLNLAVNGAGLATS